MGTLSGTTRPDPLELPDPVLAALLCAVDPFGLGGVAVRARSGPERDAWLTCLRDLCGPAMPLRRLPLHAGEDRIFGGLDLAATLGAGRPVVAAGILAEASGGLVILAMAERIPLPLAARLGAVLDTGRIETEVTEGGSPARLGIVALDEGIDDDERAPAALLERLAFWTDLDGLESGAAPDPGLADGAAWVAAARPVYRDIRAGDDVVTDLCEAATALGVGSSRAEVMALRAARAVAALAGRTSVERRDAAAAARLVLSPRATRLPGEPDAPPRAEETPPGREPGEPGADDAPENVPPENPDRGTERSVVPVPEDLVLAAARAAIPPGLLQRLQAAGKSAGRTAPGKAGALRASPTRGRPTGVRRGDPTGGARLSLVETLRAAAPWQRLRALPPTAGPAATGSAEGGRRIEIRRADLRVARLKQRTGTTTIFTVDASGSLALQRLAEVKGAVELLLADCYVRRDQVALLAFRGRGTELLLPPTRSLARAKRCLAGLAGGGGTPLAGAIEAALGLADAVRRRGQTPVVVFMTDGRANVARDGTAGRARADEEARLAARRAGGTGVRILVVDAGTRPSPAARDLAEAMRALYLPLPRAEASTLSRAVRGAAV